MPHDTLLALTVAALFATSGTARALTLTSTSFPAGGEIPTKYTCEGGDVSPALAWTGIPDETRSLALVEEDPDAPDPKAPRGAWIHWVVYAIPPTATGFAEGADATGLPPGTRRGTNDFKRIGYGGPCPPIGRHRYVHKLYALDTALPDLGAATKTALQRAIAGHIIGEAQLVGTYEKHGAAGK